MILAAISSRASVEAQAGHYFWSYKALADAQEEKFAGRQLVIGSVQPQSDFISGIFRARAWMFEFKFGLQALYRYRPLKLLREVRRQSQSGVTHFYFYDGGLSDLWLCHFLASLVPDSRFIFNFHWADQWNEIFNSKNIRSLGIRWFLRRRGRSFHPNLRYSAESQSFAKKIERIFKQEIHTFPIFAAIRPRAQVHWDNRTIDVLILPQRKTEIPFVIGLVEVLARENLSFKVGTKKEIWPNGGKIGLTVPDDVAFLPLAEVDFGALLNHSKIVVLPYDKPYFRWGSSGKFNEAKAFGCFPFAPLGSAIADQGGSDPETHSLDISNPDLAGIEIRNRLRSGPDLKDKAVYVEDLLDWANVIFEETYAKNQRPKRYGMLLLLGIFAISYRRPINLPTIRRKIGSYVDSIFKSSW